MNKFMSIATTLLILAVLVTVTFFDPIFAALLATLFVSLFFGMQFMYQPQA